MDMPVLLSHALYTGSDSSAMLPRFTDNVPPASVISRLLPFKTADVFNSFVISLSLSAILTVPPPFERTTLSLPTCLLKF